MNRTRIFENTCHDIHLYFPNMVRPIRSLLLVAVVVVEEHWLVMVVVVEEHWLVMVVVVEEYSLVMMIFEYRHQMDLSIE